MVVMEEAACFGSQAEVPGTQGAGREERALRGETARKRNYIAVGRERVGAGKELLGLGLALSC